jgi:thymidylate synthase (FAD)
VELIDVLGNVPNRTVRCLDKGSVSLIDCMPRMVPADQRTADFRVAEAARASFNRFEPAAKNEELIRFLIRERHTVPVEHVKFTFHAKAPVYVVRQWDKNRTAAKSEASGRYVEFKDEFHEVTAEQVRRQATDNKQGSAGVLGGDVAEEFAARSRMGPMLAHEHYTVHVRDGVAKEQARMLLTLNLYTQFYWTIDLHNLLNHFLALRCDGHAQEEIRVYANAVLDLIRPIVPATVGAWEDYHPLRGGLLLSRMEVEHLKAMLGSSGLSSGDLAGVGKRENGEWLAKATRIGLRGGE